MHKQIISKLIDPTVGVFKGINKIFTLRGNIEEQEIKIDDNNKLRVKGNLDSWQLYFIVSHRKFIIHRNSLKKINEKYFSAIVCLVDNNFNTKEIIFERPSGTIGYDIGIVNSRENGYLDSLIFIPPNNIGETEVNLNSKENICFQCNLSFMMEHAKNLEVFGLVPLKVQYTGIVVKESRDARHRIYEHSLNLEVFTKEINQNIEELSCILYRIETIDVDESALDFNYRNRMLEAACLQYFKSDSNKQNINFPENNTRLKNLLVENGVSNLEVKIISPRNTSLYSNIANPSNEHQILLNIE